MLAVKSSYKITSDLVKLPAIYFPIFADAISQRQIYDPAGRSAAGLDIWHSQIAEEGLKSGVGEG